MTRKLKDRKGITLLEMMTTVVIIGIVSTLAVPRFQIAWERLSIRGADRDMKSIIRLARSTAIATKVDHGIHLDPEALTITMFEDLVNPGLNQLDYGDSIIQVDSLPAEFNLLATDMIGNTLVFQPNGSAAFTGGGNIVALAVTDHVVGILVHNILASTGRVQSKSYFY